MDMLTPLLILTLFLVLLAEFVNGWTDAPNAIATVVGTRVLPPQTAVIIAVIGNILGTFSGTAVAATIGKGIVSAEFMDLKLICGAMVSIIAWGFTAARLGIPISKSHALLAGLAGAGLASGGLEALEWAGWLKVIVGLIISSFLGFILAFALGQSIQILTANRSAGPMKKTFRTFQIFSAMFLAYNHGLNDGQKFVGVLTLVLMKGALLSSFDIPYWVVLICALTMGLGTACGGWRIVRTLGEKMAPIDSWQGFSAEMGASSLIFIASRFGIPLSTTHTISTAIMGAAASLRPSIIDWGVVRRIILAWVFTFPICTLIAYGVGKCLIHLAVS